LIINKKQNTTAIASYSNCLVEKLHPDHRNNEAPRRTADNTLTSLGYREARDSTPEETRKENGADPGIQQLLRAARVWIKTSAVTPFDDAC